MQKLNLRNDNKILQSALNMALVATLTLTLTGCAKQAPVKPVENTAKPGIEKETPVEPTKRTVDFAKVVKDMNEVADAYASQSDDGVNNYDSSYSDKILGYCNGDREFINKLGAPDIESTIVNLQILAGYDMAVDKKISPFWTDMLLDSAKVDRFNNEVVKVIEQADKTGDYSEMVALAEEYKSQSKHNDPFKNVQMIMFSSYLSQTDFNKSKADFDKLQEVIGIIRGEDLTVSSNQNYVRTMTRA